MKCKPVKKFGTGTDEITIYECSVPGGKNRDFQAVDSEQELVGTLGVDEFKGDFVTLAIEVVAPGARRKRVGTRLYEAANAYACRQGGRLLSDTTRSPFAENFWRKQVQKGRAMCVTSGKESAFEPGKVVYGRYYAIWEDAEHIQLSERERKNLPEPARDERGRPFWPCRQYGVTKPCEVATLEGVRRRRGTRGRRR